MQPVTVAISPTGIEYLLQCLLGDQIAKALESHLGAPDYTFIPDNFNFLPGGSSIESDYSGISISISGGQIQSFSPAFSGCAQGLNGDNSQFAITMTGTNLKVNYPAGWHESYDYEAYTWDRGGMKVPAYSPQNGHHDNTYDYSVDLPMLTIKAIFQLAASATSYTLTYHKGSADPGNPTPNIPGGSILQRQQSGNCGYSSHIEAATATQIAKMNWSGALASALGPVFRSINDSGKLGPVTFDFLHPGDTPLAFPSGGGIQIGAKGLVTVNGSAYPVPPPADLDFPPVPTGNPAPHVTYWIQDYEVSALFWGFFKADALQTTLTSGDLQDPTALETETYADGTLAPLAEAYPYLVMQAVLSAQAAPTIAFQTIYQINPDNISKIQKALPPTIWADVGTQLTAMSGAGGANNQNPGTTFSSQTGFETVLGHCGTNKELLPYAGTIEELTRITGVVVTHTTECTLEVPQSNSDWTPVITFDVAQTLVMQGLQLGVSKPWSGGGETQSVIFTFTQPADAPPKAIFRSSTIAGIDGGDFGSVWDALRPNWQDVFAQIGAVGVPLPRIPGFDFLFQQAEIDVKAATSTTDGYLSITANVKYSPEKLTPAVRRLIDGRR